MQSIHLAQPGLLSEAREPRGPASLLTRALLTGKSTTQHPRSSAHPDEPAPGIPPARDCLRSRNPASVTGCVVTACQGCAGLSPQAEINQRIRGHECRSISQHTEKAGEKSCSGGLHRRHLRR
ncbi:Hypothetical predicted protein [Marmota monax]|uniref:Uncharacterized protein n=1 Tax=Marmota monax TaxID=9995 RepID=A0A5E4AC61_MARMO|nr:hypothetical protein GHT09_018077 [Marmota monax]VTJ54550.1 Hypothetical predicted protein [Marmota monax]